MLPLVVWLGRLFSTSITCVSSRTQAHFLVAATDARQKRLVCPDGIHGHRGDYVFICGLHADEDDSETCETFSFDSSLAVFRIMSTCNKSSSVMSLVRFLNRLCFLFVFLISRAISCRAALAASCCFLSALILVASVSASRTSSTFFQRASSSRLVARPLPRLAHTLGGVSSMHSILRRRDSCGGGVVGAASPLEVPGWRWSSMSSLASASDMAPHLPPPHCLLQHVIHLTAPSEQSSVI